jgi:hypothetical protein
VNYLPLKLNIVGKFYIHDIDKRGVKLKFDNDGEYFLHEQVARMNINLTFFSNNKG